MALFNYATKEITLKIVYYGPGLSGKTTNLQYLHSVLNPDTKGKLLSLSTESDRTLFFDFLPIELGKIRDFSIRFQLYTVPGQVRYNATRKVVLKGADGIVFVADSQKEMIEQNIESFANMRENLTANNLNPDEIPVVLQYNKRDLKNICSINELNSHLNKYNYHVTEATAVNGVGVEDSFRLITKLLLKYISKKHKIEIQPAPQKEEISEEVPVRELQPEPVPEPALQVAGPIQSENEIPIPETLSAGAELIPEYTAEVEMVTELPAEPTPSVKAAEPVALEAEIPSADTRNIVPSVTSNNAVDAIEEVIDGLSDRVDKMAHEVAGLNEALQGLQKTITGLSSGMKEIREIKQGQTEMLSSIKEIVATLDSLREKKSWFKF
jgi:signal recognition particle receptor subunit beta